MDAARNHCDGQEAQQGPNQRPPGGLRRRRRLGIVRLRLVHGVCRRPAGRVLLVDDYAKSVAVATAAEAQIFLDEFCIFHAIPF